MTMQNTVSHETPAMPPKKARDQKVIARECRCCKQTFMASHRSVVRGHALFCSQACRNRVHKVAKGKGVLANITRPVLEPLILRKKITLRQIGETLGVTPQAVSYHARKLGIPVRGMNSEPEKKCSDEDFRRLWEAGVSIKDMAEAFGYSCAQNVTQRRMMMGLEPRRPKGRKQPISLKDYLMIEAMKGGK
jgi:hypothetical protein